jgi:hypothetical protein
MRVFHAQHALPNALPASEHLVITPASEPITVKSDAQAARLVEKLARPVLITLTHTSEVQSGVWAPGDMCERSETVVHQIMYAVAQLSPTEQRRVEDRVGELLREQGRMRFLLEIDFTPAICIEADLVPPSCAEYGTSARKIGIEGGRLYVSNDPELMRRPAAKPMCGHWAWCCPCSAAWSLGLLLRPAVCATTDSSLALVHDGTGGREPFKWDRKSPAAAIADRAAATGAAGAASKTHTGHATTEDKAAGVGPPDLPSAAGAEIPGGPDTAAEAKSGAGLAVADETGAVAAITTPAGAPAASAPGGDDWHEAGPARVRAGSDSAQDAATQVPNPVAQLVDADVGAGASGAAK